MNGMRKSDYQVVKPLICNIFYEIIDSGMLKTHHKSTGSCILSGFWVMKTYTISIYDLFHAFKMYNIPGFYSPLIF